MTGVNRSALYRKAVAPSKEKLEWLEKVMERIDYWHTAMPFLGSRKLAKKLQEEDISVGRKLVRRLMYEMAIYALYPKPNLSKRNFKQAIVPYLLRNKQVNLPNQVWSVDITYIKLNRGHMYLTAVIDWYSRKIVGWNIADTLDTAYVIQTVTAAIQENGFPSIINSDQGCQFTSSEYKRFLSENRITQSMDGKSRWADNIMIERWFRSLKTEEIYVNEYANPKQLRSAIRRYVETYNTKRPHEALEYATPSEVFSAAFANVAA
ncbi:MAG: IS3 family transposase [Oscillospiraceae bacterium]